jgi:hypothetical protein
MTNSNPPDDTVVTHASPGRVVIAAWGILLALMLVFAKDVNQWAEAAENPTVQQGVAPVAGVLYDASRRIGVAAARDGITSMVHAFYDTPVMLASRQANLQLAPAPPRPPAVNAASESGTDDGEAADSQVPRTWRVLLVGDSSIQEGLGTVIERELEGYRGVTADRFGMYSTGLARPDYFDWSAKLTELKAEHQPNLIIAHWGDNDCQGLSTPAGEFVTAFGTEEWDIEYGRRVEAIIGLMRSGGASAVVIGLPIMRSRNFSKRIQRLNGVVEEATVAAGGLYLPTWDITSDEDGKYMSSVEFDGKTRIIRAGDGIHLSNHGAAYVADWVCAQLSDHFGLIPEE